MRHLLTALLFISCLLASAAPKTLVTISTNMGDMTLWLYDDTPLHRDNFLRLCRDSVFPGTIFHRCIRDFLIQGGDPQSRNPEPERTYGDGDGGFCINAEILPHHFCKRGALIDAKLGDYVNPTRMSAGTQFCVVQGRVCTDEQLNQTEERLNQWHREYLYHLARYELMLEEPELTAIEKGDVLNEKARQRAEKQYAEQGPMTIPAHRREIYKTVGGTPHLDGSVTVFGELVDGWDTVERISLLPTDEYDRPFTDVIITAVSVERR